jgi:hypothetical protein
MKNANLIALALGNAFLSGPWSFADLQQRAQSSLGENRDWIGKIVAATLRSFPAPANALDGLVAFLDGSEELLQAKLLDPPPRVFTWLFPNVA